MSLEKRTEKKRRKENRNNCNDTQRKYSHWDTVKKTEEESITGTTPALCRDRTLPVENEHACDILQRKQEIYKKAMHGRIMLTEERGTAFAYRLSETGIFHIKI